MCKCCCKCKNKSEWSSKQFRIGDAVRVRGSYEKHIVEGFVGRGSGLVIIRSVIYDYRNKCVYWKNLMAF